MRWIVLFRTVGFAVLLFVSSLGLAESQPRPDAPVLAGAGDYLPGTRSLTLNLGEQPDVEALLNGGELRQVQRELNVRIWYPSDGAGTTTVVYQDAFGSGPNDPERPVRDFEFPGLAYEDAEPARLDQPAPLVVLSHGYPGSAVLMAWLAEHLASHGYVVAGIDHSGSTHADKGHIALTVNHRPRDIRAVIDAFEQGGDASEGLSVDASRTAVVGYSMGGYGALVAAGAGLEPALQALPMVPGQVMRDLFAPDYSGDERIGAVVALAPWGAPAALERAGLPPGLALWPKHQIEGLRQPLLFVAGDQDDVSGYEDGVRWLWQHSGGSRWLLTYHNARHNVAPMPPPPDSRHWPREFAHYAEPAWDVERINDINRHYVLAFLDATLRERNGKRAYLQEHQNGQGEPKGFAERTALGFSLEYLGD